MHRFEHKIKDPNGLHARPAGLFVRCAQQCGSEVSVSKAGAGPVNAKHLFSVMGLGACGGDVITVTAEGPDEVSDAEKLRSFCEANI
ncbi:MAG TPA: HPr family phosphocarrier protein [Ruminococcaceae bacterium]|nr:HPr family phosphocarrier protein [Oscillospiraceae bacterium]